MESGESSTGGDRRIRIPFKYNQTNMMHRLSKVDLKKFDGAYPTRWVVGQIEQYFFPLGWVLVMMKN